MKLNKRVLTLFTIFCVIVSAGAVCATDLGDGINYVPDGLEPGAGLPLENQTADGPMNVTGNATTHVTANATGNTTANATANTTANATHSSANATHSPANANHSNTLLATGNPILVLFAVMIIIGSYGLFKRKI